MVYQSCSAAFFYFFVVVDNFMEKRVQPEKSQATEVVCSEYKVPGLGSFSTKFIIYISKDIILRRNWRLYMSYPLRKLCGLSNIRNFDDGNVSRS